jgi:hypothetical protein
VKTRPVSRLAETVRHFIALPALVAAIFMLSPLPASEDGAKQPFFLICPHKAGYSAWSLFFVVDAADPAKVLSMGLETLKKQNSSDSSYAAVVAAQKDSKVEREQIASLTADEFETKRLVVEKDKALQVSVSKKPDGAFALTLSLRISADGKFVIGENEKKKYVREIALTFVPEEKTWRAKVTALSDAVNAKVEDAAGKIMTGIVFPVTDTGIYRIFGVWENGDVVPLLDRTAR